MANNLGNPASNAPDLTDLFQRYLRQQVDAQGLGLARADAGAGDVLPYEAIPAQPIEPRLAWNETLLALQTAAGSPAKSPTFAVPPEWANMVAMLEPCAALSFSAGNYPQRVRNLQPLLQAKKLSDLNVRQGRSVELGALLEWARQAGKATAPQALLAIGVLRSCRQFDLASSLLEQAATSTSLQSAWDNERAALAWDRGECERARDMWQAQATSPAILFNRGMAALFMDRPADARAPLSEAVRQLPERSGWHHLARLYLAIAETRSA